MKKINNQQIEAVEICECNSEWRGVLGGNDWEECQCYVVGEDDGADGKEDQLPKCH